MGSDGGRATGGTAAPLEVTIRRWDVFPLLMVATFVGMSAFMLAAGPRWMNLALLPLLLTMAFVAFLGGPAAYLTVTPTHLVVANPVLRYVVPRSLADGVEPTWLRSIQLRLRGRAPLDLRAVSPWQPKDGRPTRRQHERRLAAVLAALDAVPPAPTTDDTVHRSYRLGHMVPLVVLLAAIVPAFVAGRHLYLHLPR